MEHQNNDKETVIVSRTFDDGRMLELIYDKLEKRTKFAVWDGATVSYANWLKTGSGETLLPVPATNNLIRHRVVMLAGSACEYGSVEDLAKEIETYIRQYVTLSEVFTKIAVRYVLLSWVYDRFNELPYLRFRGDFGSGKSRALYIIGSLLYKPMFASGASTVSPIFHTLDLFKGSLVFDEADFRFSDERAEITKILNNGNMKGFPVLRSVQTDKKVFDPRAFHVFGPKVVSMREHFDDLALESRFISTTMGKKPAKHVPINLPNEQAVEAELLRSKLLMYRFKEWKNVGIDTTAFDDSLSSRTNQVLIPLISITPDETIRQAMRDALQGGERERISVRQQQVGALVFEALINIQNGRDAVPLSEIREELIAKHGTDFERMPTPRYIGSVIRTQLNLSLYKSVGVFKVIIPTDDTLIQLAERFGVDIGT